VSVFLLLLREHWRKTLVYSSRAFMKTV
jgi:hypothetical protein